MTPPPAKEPLRRTAEWLEPARKDSHGHPRSRDGFTLVELVIALVILSIGILSVASLSSYAVWQVRRGQDLTNAAFVAKQLVENISNTPFDSVAVGSFSETFTVGGIQYSAAWSVVDATDSLASGGAELKLISVGIEGGVTQTRAEEFELAIYSDGTS